MKLLESEYNEIQAYMQRRADIKEVAFKIFKEVRLTEVEIEAAKNYYDNLKSINSIKGLDKITRADIEALLNTFEDYFSSQEEKLEKIEDTTVEQAPVKNIIDINTVAVSPLKYYGAQTLPKLITLGVAYALLILFEKFAGAGVIEGSTQSMIDFIAIYQSIVGVLMRLFLSISLILTGITTLFDIMYIMMPVVREQLKRARLVSSIADIAVLQGEC